ncbi:uncharacterized protein LOC108671859 isoform X2 [Hyalella azteca]|uniref:non-specific serine/threonine protein kinase n=1 Tax=Hyalella azteca TaxID=294128 RepID=A0A979FXB5_HYAAZ|nr:uncharacterized protein LOC108671859 isoform X2 [Hyalella azteca]
MSSSKWLASKRRSSLNQIEPLGHVSKLLTLRSPRPAEGLARYQSDSNLMKCRTLKIPTLNISFTSEEHFENHERKRSLPEEDGLTANSYIKDRRASCGPCLKRSYVRSPLQSFPESSRRLSLASVEASPVHIQETSFQRRRSLCALSPVLASTPIEDSGHKKDAFFRTPSLSPCVEDDYREDKFYFSSFGKESDPFQSSSRDHRSFSQIKYTSSDELLRCQQSRLESHSIAVSNLSDSQRYSTASGLSSDENLQPNLTHSRKPSDGNLFSTVTSRKKHIIPTIEIDFASPVSVNKSQPVVHEGFSLWLVEHVQDEQQHGQLFSHDRGNPQTKLHTSGPLKNMYRSFSKFPASQARNKNSAFSSAWLNTTYGGRNKSFVNSSSIGCRSPRRVSLQPEGLPAVRASRKLSVHLPRLRAPIFSSPVERSREKRPLGVEIGKGGFGTVCLATFEGDYVAVKKIQASKTVACRDSERLALLFQQHPHLVTTVAVVEPLPGSGQVLLSRRLQGTTQSNTAEEISLEALTRSLGLHTTTGHRQSAVDRCQQYGFTNLQTSLLKSTKTFLPISATVNGSDWLWVISELCSPTNLHTLVHSTAELTIKQKLRFLGELASGVTFLHEQGFVHRDVKPANAFLTYGGTIKLGDFGCCGDLSGDMSPVIGTIAYQAPEILQGESGSEKSDVFSLGVTMWHVLHRTVPYCGIHPHVIAYNVTRTGMRPDAPWPLERNSEDTSHCKKLDLLETMLTMLARKCWHQQSSERLSTTSVCRSLAILYLTP